MGNTLLFLTKILSKFELQLGYLNICILVIYFRKHRHYYVIVNYLY
jgi:hypothetical protein